MHPYSSPRGSRGWFRTNGHSPFVTGYSRMVEMHVVAASAYSSAASNRRFPVPRISPHCLFQGKNDYVQLRTLRGGHRPISGLANQNQAIQRWVVSWMNATGQRGQNPPGQTFPANAAAKHSPRENRALVHCRSTIIHQRRSQIRTPQ